MWDGHTRSEVAEPLRTLAVILNGYKVKPELREHIEQDMLGDRVSRRLSCVDPLAQRKLDLHPTAPLSASSDEPLTPVLLGKGGDTHFHRPMSLRACVVAASWLG